MRFNAAGKCSLSFLLGGEPGLTVVFVGLTQPLLIRQLIAVWVPHPFPRFLRERVGKNVTHFLPDQ
jgi:hypothetical protein